MNERWLTVIRLLSPSQAVQIRNLLEEAGIKVQLQEGEEYTPDPEEILVQVPATELDSARDLLTREGAIASQSSLGLLAPAAVPSAERDSTEDDAEDEEEKLEPREELAEKAFNSAIFGLVAWPLLPFSFWMLLNVYFMEGRLEGKYRRYAWLTTLIFVVPPLLVVAVILLSPYLVDKDRDMAELQRPKVLIGTWYHEEKGPQGEVIQDLLELYPDGQMHYQVLGADPFDYHGRWGYDNFGMYLRFRRKIQGDDSLIGTTSFYPMGRFQKDEMVLDLKDRQLIFHRK